LSQAGTQAGLLYQTDADKLSALQQTYENLFQKEESARQKAEAERQFQLSMKQYQEGIRQFNAQMAATERQYQRELAASQAQYAQQASLTATENARTAKATAAETARQKAIEKEAKQVAQGASWNAANPKKTASLWDEFWKPMGNSLSAAKSWLGW